MSQEWIMLAESIRISEQRKHAIKQELSELQEITSRAVERSAQLKGAHDESNYHFNGNDHSFSISGSDLQDLGRQAAISEAVKSVAPQQENAKR
jgi:hypothetical protein